MNINEHEPQRAMSILQCIVTHGRKAKTLAGKSFKDREFLVDSFIPNRIFSVCFSLGRDHNIETIRRLLRATSFRLEEEFFDTPFQLSDEQDNYPYYAGESEDKDCGIRVRLWTKDPLWN